MKMPFDKLRVNGNLTVPSVVSLSNHKLRTKGVLTVRRLFVP